jgi:hypothetical protein
LRAPNGGRDPAARQVVAAGRESGIGAPFLKMRGSGAATDFFLGGSLAPIGVTVSFLSATLGMNSIG